MKPEILQTISNFVIFGGAILAALGGFGSQYFGKQIADTEKEKNDEDQKILEKNIDDLLEGNETLKERLIPFEKLASEIHPTLKLDAALTQLKEDFKRLEEIASKYEFIPLNNQIKEDTLTKLQPIAAVFNKNNYTIDVTHETWTNAATQKYVAQLSSLLRDAGFNVVGPKQITYYLVQESAPIEWGMSPGMLDDVGKLFDTLVPIFNNTERWTKREFPETNNKLRIHFGGSAVFQKNGVVIVE